MTIEILRKKMNADFAALQAQLIEIIKQAIVFKTAEAAAVKKISSYKQLKKELAITPKGSWQEVKASLKVAPKGSWAELQENLKTPSKGSVKDIVSRMQFS